jgi:hypothetical protein
MAMRETAKKYRRTYTAFTLLLLDKAETLPFHGKSIHMAEPA